MNIRYILKRILKMLSVIPFLIAIIISIKNGNYPNGIHWFVQMMVLISFALQLIAQWKKSDRWSKIFYLEGVVLITIGLFNTFFRN